MAVDPGRIGIDAVNTMAGEVFNHYFAGVLEASPELAAAVGLRRPFRDVPALADGFATVVHSLDPDGALALILAHPELGMGRPMTAESTDEQASAGLPDLEEGLRTRLVEGNAAYRERFGFPFIIAVRGRTPEEIVGVLEARLGNEGATERATALDEVCAIARLRVGQLVDDQGVGGP